jgi:hypothetical protein
MIRKIAALWALVAAAPALAAPGVGQKVYGATLEGGVTELEARYGRLTGGAADGEDGLVLEVAHAFSDRLYVGVTAEFEREPPATRKLEAVGFEVITPLGRIEALQLDVALYGEYEAIRGGRDKAEAKLLLQHKKGPFDARLNLVFDKQLASGQKVGVGYAASADWAVVDDVRLGVAAFGNLGNFSDFAPRAEHYLGPVAKFEIEALSGKNSEFEVETGYLFALGSARDETKGQLRLLLEWEKRF